MIQIKKKNYIITLNSEKLKIDLNLGKEGLNLNKLSFEGKLSIEIPLSKIRGVKLTKDRKGVIIKKGRLFGKIKITDLPPEEAKILYDEISSLLSKKKV